MNAQSPNFKRAWKFAVQWEGSKLENVPGDDGGLTKYGVDQASHPHVNIRLLTADEAAQIYHDEEWTRCKCDELPDDLAVALFDFAMNAGTGEAVPVFQAALGVATDGFIGPRTLAAAGQRTGVLADYLARREAFYRALAKAKPEKKKFLPGWLNRVNALRKYLGVSLGGKSSGTAAAHGAVVPLALALVGAALTGCAEVRQSAYYPETFTTGGALTHDDHGGWDRQSVDCHLTWRLKPRTVIPVAREDADSL